MRKMVVVVPQQIFGGFRTYSKSLEIVAKKNNFRYKELVLLKPKNSTDYYKNLSVHKNFIPNQFAKYIFLLKLFIRTFAILKNENPSLVIGVGMLSNTIAFFFVFINNFFVKKKVKVITTVHNTFYRNGDYDRLHPSIVYSGSQKLFKLILGKSERCICVSKGIESEVIRIFNLKNTVTINNGIDIKKILRTSRSYIINEKNGVTNSLLERLNDRKIIKITTVSRLTAQKDINTAIKAFRLVNDNILNAILLIIGVGPKYDELYQLVSSLKLSSKIFFIGATRNPYYFLKRTNIYINSSLYEGFGYSIIEAMSMGKPIIATDSLYGPREILDEGKYGILTRVKSEKEMSTAIIDLITNKQKYQSYALLSKKRAQDYSIEKLISAYSALIKSLF